MSTLLSSFVLQESITHIEDLPIPEFIRTVESLREKIVTEKLDGANLWFGLDDTGLYTSREGKSPKKGRFYKVSDYPVIANYNAFRAAHLAIMQVEGTIRKFLKPGDSAEIEVLFGRQPNTVTYGVEGKNFIVILRAVNGTPEERIANLSSALNNKEVRVKSIIVSSPDGDKLEKNEETLLWQFTKVEPIEASKVNTKDATKLIGELKKYCTAKNAEFEQFTNQQIAEINLTSVPKDQRAEAKLQREKVNAYVLTTFKAPIKELLLNNFVRKIKPMLQGGELDPSEDIGVEGVVVRDPVTGSMTKIVDKDVFTAINSFNSAVRAEVSGLVRTTDSEAPIDMRGGAFGQAKIQIAELLGAKELALSSGVKKFVGRYQQPTPSATAQNIAKHLNFSLAPARTKIAGILKGTITQVDQILHDFKSEAGEFKLKLKTGKEIGVSPEVMKRTLTAFAETKQDIAEVTSRVLQSRTPSDLILALYGKTIESLFDGDSMKESFSLIKAVTEDGGAGGTGAGAVGGGGFGSGSPGPGVSQMGGVGSGAMGFGSTGASSTSSAPGGGWDSAKPAGAGGTSNVDVKSNTKAGNIAPYPFKLKGTKVVTRRNRGWMKPKKFPAPVGSSLAKPAPSMGVPEGKFSLMKAMNEDWAHVKDMKFATDVDDSAAGNADVEFKQLRNNVAVGDNVSQMDVNNYLDKAHEINDSVDTMVFGLEMDDGTVAKVYVNATQGEEFEAALSQLLGKEGDVEKVINDLANRFDIVDVEYPKEHLPVDQEPTPGVEQDIEAPLPPAEDEPAIDGHVDWQETSATGGEEEGGEVPGEVDPNAEQEPSNDEDPDEEPAMDGEEPAEEEPEEERDEFGQLIKKKPKKTEESLQVREAMTFQNPTLQIMADVLTAMGFDLEANRSFNYQAGRLQAQNSPGLIAAKQNSVNMKFKQASQAFAQGLKMTPGSSGAAPTSAGSQTTQLSSLTLLGDLVAEADAGKDGWLVGVMGSSGLLLQCQGVRIKISVNEAVKLAHGLEGHKVVSVHTANDKRFVFKPAGQNYMVFELENPKFPDGIALPSDIVQTIIEAIGEE